MATIEVCDRCEQKNTRGKTAQWEFKLFKDGTEMPNTAKTALLCDDCADNAWRKTALSCKPPVKRKP